MPFSPRLRFRAALVTFTLAAALGVATLPALAASTPAAPTAAAAPESLGSASGFAFFVLPAPQPLCTGVATDTTGDPSIDREGCGFVNFTPTGVTGTLTGELYGEGASTPFATLPVTTPAASPGCGASLFSPPTPGLLGGSAWSSRRAPPPSGSSSSTTTSSWPPSTPPR